MGLRQRLSALLHPRRYDQDLDEELRAHIEMRTEELAAGGLPREEARRRAQMAFGNAACVKEDTRATDIILFLETLAQDVRYGLRQLVRNPGFTLAAMLTLALGIGGNTAMFTAVNGVLLKAPPYAKPERLIAFRGSHSLPDAEDIGRMAQSLSAMGSFAAWPLDLVSEGPPQRIDSALVGGDLFRVFGVAPHLGSVFSAADDAARKPVVVASYEFWESHLAGEPSAIGRTIRLSGNSYTLIGVMPKSFHLPNSTSQLWIPFRVGYAEAANARGAHFMYAAGRLRDGVSLAQLNSELEAIGKRLGETYPEEARTFSAMGLRERFAGEMRTPLLVLLGAVSLVLLIACSNFATLLLARAAVRHDEMQVRSALGARPLRLIRQLLTESVTLSVSAGAIGIGLAYLGLQALLALMPEELPKVYDVSLDGGALAFTFAVSVVTGIAFGAVPALQVIRGGRFRSAGARLVRGRTNARQVLVVSEMALALMLLTGAGLLLRSLWQLQHEPIGMNPEGVLTLRLSFPASRYGPIPVQEQFLTRLDQELKMPGIEQAGLVSELPLSGWRMMHNMIIEGQPEVAPGNEPEIFTHEISPGFLDTIGAQLVTGRNFSAQDTPTSPLVGIVNQAFVNRFLSDRNPLGARVRWARGNPTPPWMTIVGVAHDIRFESPEAPQEPTIYTPYTQKQQEWKRFCAIVVRPRPGEIASVAEAVKQKVWALDPQLPVTHVLPLERVMQQAIQQRRLITVLLAAFAAVAVLLAMMGVYGVIAYLVAQREREVGVRMALGATRPNILYLMLRQGAPLLALGLLLGGAGAFGCTRVLRKLLYGTSPTDLATFAVVVCVLGAAALAAMLVPSWRATRIDPMAALRAE